MKVVNRLNREDGVAMVVLMGTLLVLGILSTVIASQATRQSRTATFDRSSKRALAAASAGVEVGRYRLNTSPPAATSCMASSPSPPWEFAAGSSACLSPAAEDLGNGASYQYSISAPLAAGATCGDAQTVSSGSRCLTSIGTVNGTSRRVQTLMAKSRDLVVFAKAGVIGLDSVSASNATNIATDVGSNGTVTVDTGARVVGQAILYTGGTLTTNTGGVVTGGPQTTTTKFQLPVPDIPTTSDPVPAGMYDAATKSISLAKTQIATLPAGKYVVCGITMANQAQLQIPAGNAVEIFVDSPARAGSTCPAGTGKVVLGQATQTNVIAGAAENLDVYIWGTSPPPATAATDFDLGNAATFYGSVYAPQSGVLVENAGTLVGALAGRTVTFANTGNLTIPAALKGKSYDVPGRFQVTGWAECRARPTSPGDISSGC